MKYYDLVIEGSCSFCQEAISLLKEQGEQFVYTDMENCEEALEKIKKQAGHGTVPMIWEIFVNGEQHSEAKFIGGCDDLKEHFEERRVETTISQ